MSQRLTNPTETITWIDPDDELPDEQIEVMLFVPDSAMVWPGYKEDDEWFYADGLKIQNKVIAWAEMPSGPAKNEDEVPE